MFCLLELLCLILVGLICWLTFVFKLIGLLVCLLAVVFLFGVFRFDLFEDFFCRFWVCYLLVVIRLMVADWMRFCGFAD